MKENFKKMIKRHKKEIEDLQSTCKHERRTGWMPYMWSPGHFGPDVRVCTFCSKIMEQEKVCMPECAQSCTVDNDSEFLDVLSAENKA